ncbi:hypothetical protein CI102_9914 [Trichoderma harzianum]|jgi:hypothetical protein|nr:hypothetical protein CI102_9914 [Trichoderma harzianum]
MPEQAPSTCALIQTETFKMQSRGPPSNTIILVLALSSPARTRQPTNSTSSPAGRHQTRHSQSPCPLSSSLPPSNPVARIRRHARYRQPHSAQRTNRRRPHCKTTQHGKGTPYGKASLPCSQAGHENSAREEASTCHSILVLLVHTSPLPVTCACRQTRRQTAIRREWELVIVKALGDCHRALSSSGSSKAVHAAKH